MTHAAETPRASLVGPTASGKTAVAVLVAARTGVEVISADSRQVYRRLDVGTAKPTAAERAAVPHHLVDVADPTETYTAARFGEESRAAAAAIRERGRLPFLVGGSGLYVRAAEEGLFEGPARDASVRARLEAIAAAEGNAALQARLAEVDAESAARLAVADRVRLVRALEVWELTGIPISEHHRRHRETVGSEAPLRFGLAWPADELVKRIEARTGAMLAAGWADEVRALLDSGIPEDAPAWNALGYADVVELVRGRITQAQARERIVIASRQFAKRQRTWFRATPGVEWFVALGPDDLTRAAGRIVERLQTVLRSSSE